MGKKIKKCSKCNIARALSEFDKDKSKKDGYRPDCKICRSKEKAQYYENNKDKVLESQKEYYENNRQQILEYHKQYYVINKEKMSKQHKQYYENNKEKIFKQHKEYINSNIQVKIGARLRQRLYQATKNNYKSGSAVKDLGCSIEELKLYLEKQFYPHSETGEQMIWENWKLDGWHIDHIIPLTSFDLTDRKQFLKACHYSNLQPLWAEENIRKSNKLINEVNNENIQK